jgi:hypothetical protein
VSRKIFLVMILQFDKTARNEMRRSDRVRFCCVRFARIRSVATSFSGQSWSTI